MASPDTLSEPPTPAAADRAAPGDPPESLEHTLAAAFPPIDATDEDFDRLADVPPDPGLLSAAPRPKPIRLADLIEAVTGIRVVYRRGEAAVPLTALISIGGALLLHLLIVAGLLTAIYLGIHIGYGGDDASLAEEPGGAGATGGGYMIADDTLTPAGPDIKTLLARTAPEPLPAPTLSRPSDPPLTPGQLAAAELAPMLDDMSMIGLSSGDQRAGHIKAATRAGVSPPSAVAVPPDAGVKVAPPLPDGPTTVLASANRAGPGTGSARAGPRPGGGDDPYGNEPIIPLTKADAAGVGRGRYVGSGLDRGGSGANNPEPTLLEWPDAEFPSAAFRHPPARSIKCDVLVLASGKVGSVTVVQSCGDPDLDAIWRSALYKARYRPAYRAGKPFDAVMPGVEEQFNKFNQ